MRIVFSILAGVLVVVGTPQPLSAGPSNQMAARHTAATSQPRVYATLGEISYGCVTIRAVAGGVVTGDLDVVVARSARDLSEGHGIDSRTRFHAALAAGNSSRGSFLLNTGIQHLTITYSPAILRYGYRQVPPFRKVDSMTIYYRVPYRSCARWGQNL